MLLFILYVGCFLFSFFFFFGLLLFWSVQPEAPPRTLRTWTDGERCCCTIWTWCRAAVSLRGLTHTHGRGLFRFRLPPSVLPHVGETAAGFSVTRHLPPVLRTAPSCRSSSCAEEGSLTPAATWEETGADKYITKVRVYLFGDTFLERDVQRWTKSQHLLVD